MSDSEGEDYEYDSYEEGDEEQHGLKKATPLSLKIHWFSLLISHMLIEQLNMLIFVYLLIFSSLFLFFNLFSELVQVFL